MIAAPGQPNGRIKLPQFSMTGVITALGAFAGIIAAWTHFENRAQNNADDIATLKSNTMILRKELRDLERNYDRQISHLDAVIAGLTPSYKPLPAYPVPKDEP